MNDEEILRKINSVLLCMSAHLDNEPDSEFADRIDDLIDLKNHFTIDKDIPKEKPFACYEVHVVQARIFGCATQCKECAKQDED